MVFVISIIVVVLFVGWGVLAPHQLSATANFLLSFTTDKFGWFYLLAAFGFLLFTVYLAFSKFGRIRLGSDDDEPEYSYVTWFAMLFSAGMGIGLVFWGVAEPIDHYTSPPMGLQPRTPEAATWAERYSFFHWGLQPWGIYAIIGLALAYFNFRKGSKGLISATFYPLLGDRVNGGIGKAIDILAIIATVFGVATSLGLGTMQINGGLNELAGIPTARVVQITIIAVVTVLFLISATTGLDKGIKILSNTNLVVAGALLLLTLLLGPTWFLFDTFTSTLGGYLQNLVQMSLRLAPFTQSKWIANWTLFYWAWWIAWAPFVGMFIARVSRGRTIREFVGGVLLVPSLVSFLWFSVFGGTALHMQMFGGIDVASVVQQDMSRALFVVLRHLPLGIVLAIVATLLIVTFFVTSADSATFVLGMLSSDGNLNPSNGVKITWGILQSLIAIVLLLSGGLQGLQTASMVAALPFAVIMIFMCFSLMKALREDVRRQHREEREEARELKVLLSRVKQQS
jgi:glycine betaine transporter